VNTGILDSTYARFGVLEGIGSDYDKGIAFGCFPPPRERAYPAAIVRGAGWARDSTGSPKTGFPACSRALFPGRDPVSGGGALSCIANGRPGVRADVWTWRSDTAAGGRQPLEAFDTRANWCSPAIEKESRRNGIHRTRRIAGGGADVLRTRARSRDPKTWPESAANGAKDTITVRARLRHGAAGCHT